MRDCCLWNENEPQTSSHRFCISHVSGSHLQEFITLIGFCSDELSDSQKPQSCFKLNFLVWETLGNESTAAGVDATSLS